jgi:hexosaminidase
MSDLFLFPQPRYIYKQNGTFKLENEKVIWINGIEPQRCYFMAHEFQHYLLQKMHMNWMISASSVIPENKTGLEIKMNPELVGHAQGYRLSIDLDRITITGNDLAGAFYGICTLKQIIFGHTILNKFEVGCLDVLDWPDFPARGVMLDISRDKVPTLETLFMLVDLFANLKLNQLQLYTEHTFAYLQHPDIWNNSSPMTGEDILALDRYCSERFIELVPNQNSFGHLHRWFQYPVYAPLGELYESNTTHWWGKGSFSLCPTNPKSLKWITSLYDELLPHFTSKMFNIGCDETFDLGMGKSKAEVEEKGKGRVYLDFLMKLYSDVAKRGRSIQFWGDIVLQHPELVSQLPRDLIALEWGYEANHPFNLRTEKFSESGIPFYVCPGTSAWNSIAGRTDNALKNLQNAASAGIQNGAVGYLNTDWGDNGHWQVLPVSYLGYAAGAGYSWQFEGNKDVVLSKVLDYYLFQDLIGCMGSAAYELGNVYQWTGLPIPNASALFMILQNPIEKLRESQKQVTSQQFDIIDEVIERAFGNIERSNPQGKDGENLKRELKFTVRLLQHSTKRGRYVIAPTMNLQVQLLMDLDEIIEEYKSIWLFRNRPGGLPDSINRFQPARNDYINT